MEGDKRYNADAWAAKLFLSTPSGWRATITRFSTTRFTPYFYPRPPGGGRLTSNIFFLCIKEFLSTPSGWRATTIRGCDQSDWQISIHALRVEGDRKKVQQMSKFTTISIHALRVEGDGFMHLSIVSSLYFYPRPPGGGRLGRRMKRNMRA